MVYSMIINNDICKQRYTISPSCECVIYKLNCRILLPKVTSLMVTFNFYTFCKFYSVLTYLQAFTNWNNICEITVNVNLLGWIGIVTLRTKIQLSLELYYS